MSKLIKQLVKRMQKADPSEKLGVAKQMKNKVKEWEALIAEYPNLRYESKHKSLNPLLVQYDDRNKPQNKGRWPTLNSVRNVDAEIEIKIWGEKS